MKRFVALALVLTPLAALAAERADVDDEEWNPDLPVEAQRETEEARTTHRINVSANFGYVSEPGGGFVPRPPNVGPSIAVAAPFWVGTRRPYNQFLLEARVQVGWVLSQFVLLTMSPMWGMNFYFGRYVGLESRLGLGFGAQLSSVSHFGVAFQGETGIVLRVLGDDRRRIKLLGGVGMQLFFTQSSGGLSAWLGAGFETDI